MNNTSASLSFTFADDYYRSPENRIDPVPEGLFTFAQLSSPFTASFMIKVMRLSIASL
jgi:hypothetical protein